MPHFRLIGTLALLTLAISACGAADRTGAPAVEVRDSAGITIIENAAPVWGAEAQWQISAEPSLEIGLLDGPDEYQFERIAGAARLTDGRIVIADGGSRELRYYDEAGRHLIDAGGQGGGPGEFEVLSTLALIPGDSIAGWDSRAKRLTIFDGEGRLGRALTLAEVPGFNAALRGIFGDGSIVVSPGEDIQELMSREPGEYRSRAVYLWYSSAGEFIDTLLVAPGEEKIAYREGSSFGNRSILFSRRHEITLAGDRLYEGVSDEYRIMAGRAGNPPDRIIRRLGELRPVRGAELEEAVRRATESQERSQRTLAEMLGTGSGTPREPDIVHRESYPAFSRFLTDTGGNLWVQEYPVPGADHHEWSVFDPDGHWLGSLEVPAALHIYQIGSDYLLGRWQDEFEVHYMRMYQLTRS